MMDTIYLSLYIYMNPPKYSTNTSNTTYPNLPPTPHTSSQPVSSTSVNAITVHLTGCLKVVLDSFLSCDPDPAGQVLSFLLLNLNLPSFQFITTTLVLVVFTSVFDYRPLTSLCFHSQLLPILHAAISAIFLNHKSGFDSTAFHVLVVSSLPTGNKNKSQTPG